MFYLRSAKKYMETDGRLIYSRYSGCGRQSDKRNFEGIVGGDDGRLTMQNITVTGATASPELMSQFRNTEPELQKPSPEALGILSVAAHDLRNPVSAIIALAETLADGACADLSPWGREVVADLLHASEVTLRLIDNLLDVSVQPEKRLRLRTVDVRNIVDESVHLNCALSRRRGLQLVKRSARRVPLVRADSSRILRVISELISNAMDASAPGQSIEVRVGNRGPYVEVAVQDHGAGIAPENAGQLFVATTRSEAHQGRRRWGGLGLAIVHEIIDAHDGHIRVSSKLGVGSTFVVSLPVAV